MRASAKRYTKAEIDRGLIALAMAGGSPAQAHKLLDADGFEIREETLRRWKTNHADRYAEVEAEQLPKLEEEMIRAARRTISQAADVEALALEKTREQLEAGTVKDASTAARNMATVRGISTDKYMALTGKPVQVIEHRRSTADIMRAMEARGWIVEGTATEDPSSQLGPAADASHPS